MPVQISMSGTKGIFHVPEVKLFSLLYIMTESNLLHDFTLFLNIPYTFMLTLFLIDCDKIF